MPLPSSPHCAPSTAIFISMHAYRSIATVNSHDSFSTAISLHARQSASRSPTTATRAVALDAARPRARGRRRARRRRSARPPATRRSTASTPGSARSPKSRIPPDALGALQLQPAAQPRRRRRRAAAGPRRARDDGAARQRARARATRASGVATLERSARAAQPRACIRVVPSRGSVGASGDLAPLAHLALVLIGEGDATVGGDARSLDGRDGAARAPGWRRSRSTPKEGLALINGTQASRRCWRWRCSAPSGWRAPPTSPRRCRSTRCAGRSIRSSRAFTTARPHRRAAHVGRQPRCGCCAAARINQSHENCGRVQDAYSMRCAAAGARRGARRARASSRATVDDRGQRRHRQPDGVRRQPATSSRAATSTARRSRSPPICSAIALAQLATISERRTDRLVNPALSGLPAFLTARRRAAVGLHAGAGDRRGAGVGAEDARASGQRGHDPDLGEQGGPRQHEHGRRAEGASARSQLAHARRRDRDAAARARRSICWRR